MGLIVGNKVESNPQMSGAPEVWGGNLGAKILSSTNILTMELTMNTTTIIQNTLWFSGSGFSFGSERFSSVVKVIPIWVVNKVSD